MQSDTPPPGGNQPPEVTPPAPKPPRRPKLPARKWLTVGGAAVLIIVLVLVGFFVWPGHGGGQKTAKLAAVSPKTTTSKTTESAQTTNYPGLQLDANKNYGDKYANGILPVGDGKYLTSGPKTGYVYACSNYAKNLATDAGGAGRRGPWFIGTTQYDVNKKLAVEGSVSWQSSFSDEVNGGTRLIKSNDLPNHPTGIFPISPTDPAYTYDKNPNSIQSQSFTYDLNSSPVYNLTPSCEGGQVGVMLTGVALFSGFDAGGRDAGAWEVQDSCNGHPQSGGIYHYHTLSSCIKDTSVKTVIGFALDGFPITGPQVGPNNILATADLDECHGLTSQIVLDGKTTTMYHYVMTQDFPYSVSCYRGTAIQPPGQQDGVTSGNQNKASGPGVPPGQPAQHP